MSSILHAITNGLGFTSSRDNGAAQRATDAANNANTGLYNDYRTRSGQNTTLSDQLANKNYMADAQNVYGQQQTAAQMLYNQATGNAPSAAQLQQNAGLANANNQVQAAALANQGGMNPGATQRNLLAAQAQQNAAIVSQGMAARAAEQAQQQQAYSGMLANLQNQQQNMAQFQYGQGQNNLNYRAQNAAALLNNGQQTQQLNLQNTSGNIAQNAAANAAQAQAFMNTAGAAATGGATLSSNGFAGLRDKVATQ